MLDIWKLAISIIHRSKNRVNPSTNHWFSQRTTSNAGSCVCFCRSLDFSSCSWGWYIMHPPAPWNLNMGIALAAHFHTGTVQWGPTLTWNWHTSADGLVMGYSKSLRPFFKMSLYLKNPGEIADFDDKSCLSISKLPWPGVIPHI